MDKVYKATLRALGARDNGTDRTSCVDNAAHVKQILMLLGLSFSIGALSFGFRGLPDRVEKVEESVSTVKSEVLETKTYVKSINERLGRIEDVLMDNRRRKSDESH